MRLMEAAMPEEYVRRVAHPTVPLRVARAIGWSFVWFGLFLLGFVVHQLFVTDVLAARAQQSLEDDLVVRSASLVQTVAFDPETGSTGSAVEPVQVLLPHEETLPGDDLVLPTFDVDPEERVLLTEPIPGRGEAVGRIRVPDLDLWWTAVEGVARDDLKKGPGHMPGTPLPGQPGNAVVSGHRTTYGAPFFDFDQLEPGSLIFWDSPVIGTSRYVVREILVVAPQDVWVTDPLDGAWLTLTTCNPKFSARERLVVRAEMIDGTNAAVIRGAST